MQRINKGLQNEQRLLHDAGSSMSVFKAKGGTFTLLMVSLIHVMELNRCMFEVHMRWNRLLSGKK